MRKKERAQLETVDIEKDNKHGYKGEKFFKFQYLGKYKRILEVK